MALRLVSIFDRPRPQHVLTIAELAPLTGFACAVPWCGRHCMLPAAGGHELDALLAQDALETFKRNLQQEADSTREFVVSLFTQVRTAATKLNPQLVPQQCRIAD